MNETFEQKNERNRRVQDRYDELMAAGEHGHYETIFRIVREEIEAAHAPQPTDEQIDAIALSIGLSYGGREGDIRRLVRTSLAARLALSAHQGGGKP